MLTDKEKAIALECGIPLGKADAFLSSIRDAQEAVLYQCTGCGRVTESIDDDWSVLKLGGFRSCC